MRKPVNAAIPGMVGADYAKVVTHKESFCWDEHEQPNEVFTLSCGTLPLPRPRSRRLTIRLSHLILV